MKITALVENTSNCGLKAVHGLSFYIETRLHRLLFDLGPDSALFQNAARLGIDLAAVDTVVISHGHYDHGGALKKFLALNPSAGMYVQRTAFAPHYSKAGPLKLNIGLDPALANAPNVILLDGDHVIDEELTLFTAKGEDTFRSEANRVLYGKNGPDDFRHEQDLLITESVPVLITGCAHAGVMRILHSAPGPKPAYCVGGFHVYNPVNRRTVSAGQLETLSAALKENADVRFYTCHCTGKKAFSYLQAQNENVFYISAGDVLEI